MPNPDPPDTDALAELLADRVLAMVAESHPHGSPLLRRRAARLYLRQLTGRAAPPGSISTADLAAALGLSRSAAARLETRALLRAKDALQRRGESFPALLSHLTQTES